MNTVKADAPSMVRAALWYASRGIAVFPAHEPIFDDDYRLVGCTCEQWRRTEECRIKRPHLFLQEGQRCNNPGKCPRLKWRDKSTTDPDTIRKWWSWWPKANIGIDCGKSSVVAVDADLYKDVFDADTSTLPETVVSITGGGGEHYWYRQPEGCHYGNETGELPAGLDIRGEGGYIIAPPSLHKSGNRYQFEFDHALHEIDMPLLPETIRNLIDGGRGGAARRMDAEPNSEAVKKAAATVKRILTAANIDYTTQAEWGEGMKFILTTCPFNPPDDPHNEKGDDAVVVVEADGTIGAMCQHARCRARIESEAPKAADGKPSAWAWIKSMAHLTTPPTQTAPAQTNGYSNGAAPHQTQAQPPEAILSARLNSLSPTDEGNAQAFAMLEGKRFLHCDAFGWLTWTGTHWDRESGEKTLTRTIVEVLARRIETAAVLLRDEATQPLAKKIISAALPNAGHVRNCAYLLPSLLAVSADAFDTEPHLVNAANGVVNLKTRELVPHHPNQRFTYCLSVAYKRDADSSGWTRFLAESIEGGLDALYVLQASMGYWLTGETSEEKLWYIHGATRAGKGVMMETLAAVMGNKLFGNAQFNTFTKERDGNDQGFDLAGLRSARLVFAEESNRQDYLNPGRIKAWTGGGSITCAFKHRDSFSYQVQWKGVLASNHPINTDATDDALWGRVQIWNFPHSHLGSEDLMLKSRMRRPAFLEGVFAWLVDGAAIWYELIPFGGIANVTPDYMTIQKTTRREELDLVGRWLEENCMALPNLWTSNHSLYEDFAQFCKDSGQKPYTMVSLAMALTKRGFTSERRYVNGKRARGFVGLGLAVAE